MLQIFAIFYLPGLLNLFVWPQMNTGWEWFDATFSTRFIAALVAFAINYAAYFSEIFRGGIQSISQGQYEAGQVLGMKKGEIFFNVVLLQVVKRIIPQNLLNPAEPNGKLIVSRTKRKLRKKMNKKIALFSGTSRDDVETRANNFMSKHNVVDVQIQNIIA